MQKNNNRDGFQRLNSSEPISNTNLLLIITVCTFVGMYGMAMAVWGGGFLNPQ